MKVIIELSTDEVRDAILEYLKAHRPDFIAQEINIPPSIGFKWHPEALDGAKLVATVCQELPVHHGDTPYR
jgi:hypothetical protein